MIVVGKIFLLAAFVFFIIFAVMILLKSPEHIVVCFGDSITYGAETDGHSWVNFLSKEHPDVNFVNEGRNGRKTADRDEILPVLRKYPDAYAFVIVLGVNDLKDGNDSMVETCVENTRWMIEKVKESSSRTRIFVVAPCEINVEKMSLLNVKKKYNENTERSLGMLEKGYRSLAREESVGFISLLRVVSPGNYVDGLHPDIAGQEEIAFAMWRGLGQVFR